VPLTENDPIPVAIDLDPAAQKHLSQPLMPDLAEAE
jgi:hypothetical protein